MAYKSTCPTLKKVLPDEPIFVLRAQDFSAPDVILDWITRNPQLSESKRQEAFACSELMRQWKNRKVAD